MEGIFHTKDVKSTRSRLRAAGLKEGDRAKELIMVAKEYGYI